MQSAIQAAIPRHQDQELLRQQRKPLLVLLGKDDPIIRGVNTDVYREIFGGVTVEGWRGRHSFFLQDSELFHDRIIEWLDKNVVLSLSTTTEKIPTWGEATVITESQGYNDVNSVMAKPPGSRSPLGGPRGCYEGGMPPQ